MTEFESLVRVRSRCGTQGSGSVRLAELFEALPPQLHCPQWSVLWLWDHAEVAEFGDIRHVQAAIEHGVHGLVLDFSAMVHFAAAARIVGYGVFVGYERGYQMVTREDYWISHADEHPPLLPNARIVLEAFGNDCWFAASPLTGLFESLRETLGDRVHALPLPRYAAACRRALAAIEQYRASPSMRALGGLVDGLFAELHCTCPSEASGWKQLEDAWIELELVYADLVNGERKPEETDWPAVVERAIDRIEMALRS